MDFILIYCTTSQVLYVVYMLLTISSLLNSQVKTAAQVNMFLTQLYMLPSMNACPLNLIIYIYKRQLLLMYNNHMF